MAEQALSLREYPQIIELLSVLEQNGLMKQKEEVQSLVGYIEGMEEKFAQMMSEIQEMHGEVSKLQDKGIRARCSQLVTVMEEKIQQAKTVVSTTKSNLIVSAGNMVKTFQEKGRAALQRAVETLRIPSAFSRMEKIFSRTADAMRQSAGRLDVIREELHEVGSHTKNAGRVLLGKSQEQVQALEPDKGILAKLRGFMESCGKSFSEMGHSASRMAEKLGGEKSSVKSELDYLKSDRAKLRRISTGKEQVR